jgi:hypothetical protein
MTPGAAMRHLLALLSVVSLAGTTQAGTPPLELFATSDTVRVFEDGFACPSKTNSELRLSGLRNETISGQCVVRAHKALAKLTASVGALERTGGGSLPASCVTWRFVTSIFIEKNTPKVCKADLVRPAPAWFPDCLSEERECAVAQDALKAIYLTVRIPRTAQPGEYRGLLTVTADAARAALPLRLTVYPLTMPDARHLMVVEWFSTSQFKRHHAVESPDTPRFEQILQAYIENMVAHRHNTFRASLGLIESTLQADGALRLDFTAFDRWAQRFWDTGRMDLMETGFVANFFPGHWSSLEIRLSDHVVKEASTGKRRKLSGEEFLAKFLPPFVKHLRDKGWLNKTVFHIADEPSNHNVLDWRKAADVVHRYAPELRRIDAIETPHCQDRLEVWVPKLDHLATWQAAYEAAQRRGAELWFYTVGIYQAGALMNKTVDMPLIDTRLMHWLNYRYDLKGYLHWGLNAWTADPWNAPGEHRGDGWHVYPKRDGLLDSLRWEQMRDGLQDYECLWLLEDKVRQMRSKLSPAVAEYIDPRRRGVEIATQVVRSYTDFSREPEVLYAARRQAIEETLALDVTPRALVQTNPPEHTLVSNDAMIDVHGWVEPGTRVKIGHEEIAVTADGLFFAHPRPSHDTGKITVTLENGAQRKTIERAFRLQFPPAKGK